MREVLPGDAQLLFFGSRARGDNRNDSDWDILILLNKNKLDSFDYDMFVYPLRELDEWEKGNYTPFYKNIQQDAVRLL